MDPKPKADLLAKTFRGKCKIPDRELNAYSAILPTGHVQDTFLFPTDDRAFKELSDLRENSGTGPDECPAKILKVCAKELAPAVAILTTRIIACMIWPECWKQHWICPIFKKNAVFQPANYRGVHLTAQLSKVVERLIKAMINPYLERTVSYGENQFAYREKRGSRDVLALLVLEWMQVFDRRGNIAVYCSDVAGAFDRVDLRRLAAKLKAKGLNKRIVQL